MRQADKKSQHKAILRTISIPTHVNIKMLILILLLHFRFYSLYILTIRQLSRIYYTPSSHFFLTKNVFFLFYQICLEISLKSCMVPCDLYATSILSSLEPLFLHSLSLILSVSTFYVAFVVSSHMSTKYFQSQRHSHVAWPIKYCCNQKSELAVELAETQRRVQCPPVSFRNYSTVSLRVYWVLIRYGVMNPPVKDARLFRIKWEAVTETQSSTRGTGPGQKHFVVKLALR